MIRYYADSSTEYFMCMYTEIIRISNINGYIEISGPVDYRGYLYKNKWYFIYVNTDVEGQCIFPILMDADAKTTSIDDIAKIMLDTLPKTHPDAGEFF